VSYESGELDPAVMFQNTQLPWILRRVRVVLEDRSREVADVVALEVRNASLPCTSIVVLYEGTSEKRWCVDEPEPCQNDRWCPSRRFSSMMPSPEPLGSWGDCAD
jgi:hypothetical protein